MLKIFIHLGRDYHKILDIHFFIHKEKEVKSGSTFIYNTFPQKAGQGTEKRLL